MTGNYPLIACLLIGLPAWAQPDGPRPKFQNTVPVQSMTGPALELVAFEAEPAGGQEVAVRWTTGQERPGALFLLERSADRMNWVPAGRYATEDGGEGYHGHDVMDNEPLPGVSYYRLSLETVDSLTVLSDDFAVDLPETQQLLVEGDPLPGHFTVEGHGVISDLRILNDRGQFMPMELDLQGERVRVNAELLPPGRYYLKAVVDGDPILRLVVIAPGGAIMG